MRIAVLFVVLMATWLLMSGHYNPLLIGLGVVSCAFTVWCAHLARGTDQEGLPLHLLARLPGYIVWLCKEIVTANWATAKIILKNTPAPDVFEVPATQRTAAGLVTYANSITLTPGTVTIDVTEGDQPTMLVHSLHPEFRADVETGEMDRRVTAIEKMPAGEGVS